MIGGEPYTLGLFDTAGKYWLHYFGVGMGDVSLLCKCQLDFAVEQGSIDCK
jgi:hypothetical protein